MRALKKIAGSSKNADFSKGDQSNESVFSTSTIQKKSTSTEDVGIVDATPLLSILKSDQGLEQKLNPNQIGKQKTFPRKIKQLRKLIRFPHKTEKQTKRVSENKENSSDGVIPIMTQSSEDSSMLRIFSNDSSLEENQGASDTFYQLSIDDFLRPAPVIEEKMHDQVDVDPHTWDTSSSESSQKFDFKKLESDDKRAAGIESKQDTSKDEESACNNGIKPFATFGNDIFTVLDELLVMENLIEAEKNIEEEESIDAVVNGVLSLRRKRHVVVCDQSYGDISDIEPSFSDTDSIWTSISLSSHQTAKISNRKCDNKSTVWLNVTDENTKPCQSETKGFRREIMSKMENQNFSDNDNDTLYQNEYLGITNEIKKVFKDILNSNYSRMENQNFSNNDQDTLCQNESLGITNEIKTVFKDILNSNYSSIASPIASSFSTSLLKSNLKNALKFAGIISGESNHLGH